jgi:hypothetical protein
MEHHYALGSEMWIKKKERKEHEGKQSVQQF